MKKKLLFIILIILFCFDRVGAISRETLEDYVVSTALSYLHNNKYTDYDQYPMDANTQMSYSKDGVIKEANNNTMNWRNVNVSPEEISRTNLFSIDCSSFSYIVYKYSLGYDFSEHYKAALKQTFYTFDSKNNIFVRNTVKSKNDIYNRVTNLGKGLNGRYYMAAAALEHGVSSTRKENPVVSNETQNNILDNVVAGKVYTDTSNKKMGVFIYRFKNYTKGNTSHLNELESVYSTMLSILRPGDIINYINYSGLDKNGYKDFKGHSMVYVGGVGGKGGVFGVPGIIHSMGSDFYSDNASEKLNSLSSSDDAYSVRFDTLETLSNRLRSGNLEYIVVVRPINKVLCGDKICSNSVRSEFTSNAKARTTLKWLRTEQYARTTKASIDMANLGTAAKENTLNISKYNSVNVGDTIEYTLLLQNNSYKYYCTGVKGGNYSTKETCPNASTNYKRLGKSNVSFSNLVVTANIPANTTFVKCNYDCTVKDGKITWKPSSLSNGKYISIRYSVKVGDTTSVKNSGMTIKASNGDTLKMGEIFTKVNPTLNKVNAEQFREKISEFKSAAASYKIKYGSSTTTYKVASNGSNGVSTFLSDGFVKNIYYNAMGIELDDLTGNNIKNAIFNKDKQFYSYAKKTSSDIAAITKTSYKNINNMLVKGFYGGRHLKGNDNGDRVGRLRLSDLEFGDIIVTYTESDGVPANISTFYMYLGHTNLDSDASAIENDKKGTFVRFTSGNKLVYETGNAGYEFFNKLYTKDLFVVLRPTQVYGSTVLYSGGTILGKALSVEYNTYKNLKDLTSSKNFEIKLNYNNSSYKCSDCQTSFKGGNTFGGWYSDSKYKNSISNGSKISDSKNYTIYSKWIKNTFKLPSGDVDCKYISGWYKNSSLSELAGNVGETYKINDNITLYAKWANKTYYVKYNSNGGSGTMSNSTHKCGVSSKLSDNKFSKSGYVLDGWSTTKGGSVKYKDGASIEKLTSTNKKTVELFAVWRKQEKNEFTVSLKVKNGTADASNKIVSKGKSVTFEVKANKGYENGTLSCENGKLENNKLTVSNVTKDMSCTVSYSGIKYSVIYNANGGSGTMESSSHVYGTSKRLNEKLFTRNGYDFVGWSTTKNGTKKYSDKENVLNLTTNKSITLYAVWSVKDYKISYNLNGGILEDKVTSYRITSNDIKLGIPEKEGYRFKGWSSNNSEDIIENVIIKKGSTGNKTYTAHYELGNYKITYKSDKYGKITGINEEVLEYRKSPSGTTQTVNEGYKNLKWAIDKDVTLKDGSVILSGEPISEKQIKEIVVKDDLVITIYHYAKKFKVTYKNGSNGNISSITSEEVSYSSNPLGTKVKANRGYKFKTWTANKNVKLNNGKTIKKGEVISNIKSIVISEDLELTPVFEAGTFNVVYQSDEYSSISGIESDVKTYPSVISNTSTSALDDNYVFGYWTANVDVNLNNDKVISKGEPITNEEFEMIVADCDMILTAHYKQVVYNIYYSDSENIIIKDNIKEEVPNSKDIIGPSFDEDVVDEVVFISDKDVILENGKTIKAGKAITLEQLKQVKLTSDLNLVPKYKKDVSRFEFLNIKFILLILCGVVLLIVIIYVIRNNKNNKNNNKNSSPKNFGSSVKKKKFSLYRDYYN